MSTPEQPHVPIPQAVIDANILEMSIVDTTKLQENIKKSIIFAFIPLLNIYGFLLALDARITARQSGRKVLEATFAFVFNLISIAFMFLFPAILAVASVIIAKQ